MFAVSLKSLLTDNQIASMLTWLKIFNCWANSSLISGCCVSYLYCKEEHKKSSLWQLGHLAVKKSRIKTVCSQKMPRCLFWSGSEWFESSWNFPSSLAVVMQKVVISLSFWLRRIRHTGGRTLYSGDVLLAPWRQTGRNVGAPKLRQGSHFIVSFRQSGHHKHSERGLSRTV